MSNKNKPSKNSQEEQKPSHLFTDSDMSIIRSCVTDSIKLHAENRNAISQLSQWEEKVIDKMTNSNMISMQHDKLKEQMTSEKKK